MWSYSNRHPIYFHTAIRYVQPIICIKLEGFRVGFQITFVITLCQKSSQVLHDSRGASAHTLLSIESYIYYMALHLDYHDHFII